MGWPARRAGGVAGELAGANAVRNPGRTASTAAALMIGLTLVTVVAVLGAGINAATKSAITDQVHADYVVDGKQGLPFSAAEGDKLAATPGVTSASHVRVGHGDRAGRGDARSPGSTRRRSREFYSFDVDHGLRPDARTSSAPTARSSRKTLRQGRAPEGRQRRVASRRRRARSARSSSAASTTRREQNPLLGDVSMTQAGVRRGVQQPEEQLHVPRRRTPARTKALAAAAKDSGDATFHTGAAYPKDATKDMATVMAMLYVLLGFSVIVSLFGMVNTMVLSVFERTREIGMLRTIGMTRRQARRMIRHESVITALIGAALGLGLGLFLAGLVTKAVSMDGLAFVDPRPGAGRVHAGRRHRGHRRGDPPRTAGLAAQRARRAPLRVSGADDDRDATPRGPRPAPPRRSRGGAVGLARPSSS